MSFAKLAEETGLTASEHIRRAADAYLAAHPPGKWRFLQPNPPIVDAEGYVHAQLTAVAEDWEDCGGHDVRRLAWTFSPPGARRPLEHTLWTGFWLMDDRREDLETYSFFTQLLLR